MQKNSRHLHDGATPTPTRSLTRRQILLAGLSTVGALGGANVVRAVTESDDLNARAVANQRAVRIPPATTVPPPSTTIPLGAGEILFPIVATDGDYVFVTDSFGDPRGCCRSHEAVDILADEGLPLQAVVAGVLTKQYVDSGLTFGAGHGWTLTDPVTNTAYKYFHMAGHADGLSEGDEVEQGQVIGYVGETGSSGANSPIDNFHCHFEYRPDDIARDPFHRLQRAPHVIFEGE